MNKRMNKGFTLVEIMIVVAIIAILAAVAIPNFINYRKQSQATACVANLKQIQSAKEQFLMQGKNGTGQNGAVAEGDLWGDNTKLIKNAPKCPAGGTYTIGGADEEPTCSLGENSGFNHQLTPTTTTPSGS